MSTPAVTVLMPVYNSEKFLREAIDSILNQTLRDFEFLIIDDGSSDSSVEVVNSYRDSRIRLVINKENLGISATLNKGIELAASELIARMDADDISYPARLQKQRDYFLANPDCALLSAWAREITEDYKPLMVGKWKSSHYYYSLTFHCWIYHPTVMYKRAAVIDVGKYAIPYCEDYDLWCRLSRKYKIGNLEEVLLDYRLTDVSLTRETKKQQYETAQSELVRRNIEYYTNNSVQLSHGELECLQNNCDLLVRENNLAAIVQCFEKLDRINRCILEKDNVNRDEKCIREAAADKKQFLIQTLRHKLPKTKLVMLLLAIGHWQSLASVFVGYLQKKVKSA